MEEYIEDSILVKVLVLFFLFFFFLPQACTRLEMNGQKSQEIILKSGISSFLSMYKANFENVGELISLINKVILS